jgi:hypothetical protein
MKSHEAYAMATLHKASMSLALLLGATLLMATTSVAQEGPGGTISPGRDCQTITTCQFKKGGSYRGCLSSYSCRVCRFVRANCSIGGTRGRTCSEVRCTWG